MCVVSVALRAFISGKKGWRQRARKNERKKERDRQRKRERETASIATYVEIEFNP